MRERRRRSPGRSGAGQTAPRRAAVDPVDRRRPATRSLSGWTPRTGANRTLFCEKKDPSTPVTWMEYEALRDHLTRELRVTTETFDTEIQGVNLKVDEATTAINTVQTSMTTLQASMNTLTQAVHDIRTMVQQQPQQPLDEDGSVNGDNADAAAAQGMGRGVGRGLPRGVNRGFVEIGARRVPQQQDDGLGKPKFSIPRFEGGTDVEEYLTWELKIERLWRLHPDYTEDRKIKLASSEFDGYALRWWDALVQNREEDGELPIITWRTMKAAMRARFVPTNYLRSVFDKLTQLKQGVMTVDAYYMEMEMLMQRARVRESLEMTLQRFLNGLKFNIKGIVRHHKYATMNELLHHAREAESQLAEEAQQRGRATGAGRYTPRPPPSTAPSTRPTDVPSSSSKPVSNVSNTKRPVPAASGTGSSMSTARNRDMLCHTCGGKGHFKKDCPNRKVMIINEDNEYETGDDADPDAPEDDDYDSDSFDAYPSEAQTIVVSQRVLNVQPSASTQRCNLFQTKTLVGPDKACKEFGDVFPEEVPAGLPPLRVLRDNQLYGNLEKCTFCKDKVIFLGYVVSQHGVEVDESKIEAIQNWPTPMNVSQVRSFHGLAGFYRRFVPNFSTIAAPLNDLTKKGVVFEWGAAQDHAFDELKRLLTSAPLLALPYFNKQFEIECDASGIGIGGCLMRVDVHVRWEPQEEGMMRTAVSFPQYETKVIESRSQEAREGCWWRSVVWRNTSETGANVEPAQHNQSTLPQHNNEVVNLTGLLKTKD
ncbi:hypothetical protein QYE76_025430 [Lolium multiflorum]|uniref:CCHC-type domain-containing protein n=1 Tax=Lolium multiflorum TaxID=4521 RepID=A0AAD8RE37_LOLMU|nr:hypothetical protein QYE76_025430 [Lolium multiflorum]